ncbi:MAG: ABC transporter permease [Devosia sp.]|nr:ABC transporter permease [Devosia sp.]
MNPALRIFLQRLGTSLLVLFGVSVLIFLIARVIPGDPARIALGPNATPAAVAALRQQLHLNDPLIAQYGYFISGLLHGDLGISLYTNRPVTLDLLQFLPATLELIIVSGLMIVAFGLPLGVLGARYRNTWVDSLVRVLSLLGVSAPGFVWAVVLMLIFAYFLPIFPIAGRISDSFHVPPVTGFLFIDAALAGNLPALWDGLRHIILPAFALALSGIGQVSRLTRAHMIETYDKPYIEMAEAYGFPEGRIARKYAFWPSMVPSLTIIGLEVAALLGNAFLVESVFAWPGLSKYGVQVILRKDLNAIVGTVLVISCMFLIANIVVDLLVVLINPRIRLSQRQK